MSRPTYQGHAALPTYRAWDGSYVGDRTPLGDRTPTVKSDPISPPIWSTVGGFPLPPEIGSRVFSLGGFGASRVEGYFSEHGYLGLRLRPDVRPDWHRKQNPERDVVCMFGAEIKPLVGCGQCNEPETHAADCPVRAGRAKRTTRERAKRTREGQ